MRRVGEGARGQMSYHCFLEGANIHHYAFVEGAIILPCQLLGGQMSTHTIFHRGADVRGVWGGGKCPAPVTDISSKYFCFGVLKVWILTVPR